MEVNEIIENLPKMQINLDKLSKLDNDNRKVIIDFFNSLMNSINGTSGNMFPGGSKYDIIRAYVLYNTLTENEYLITRRESNLNKILE